MSLVLLALFLHGLYQEIWWMLAAAAIALVLYDIKFSTPAPEPAKA